MEYRPIEVKLVCARDLKDVNVFSRMDVYVIGSISGDPRSIKRTTVAKDGGTNPIWNYEMNFAFDESAARLNRLGLVFQIMADRALGDKEVGRVYVPLKVLFDNVGDESPNNDKEKHVIYQVQTLRGKFRGKLEFSYKFGVKFTQSLEGKLDEPVIAYLAMGPNPMSEFESTSIFESTPKLGTGTYPSVGATFGHSVSQFGNPPQSYGSGYGCGYGCGYEYPSQPIPLMYPNPFMGFEYGNKYAGGCGYTTQALSARVEQPRKQKSKKTKFGLGVGTELLGGLLVGRWWRTWPKRL